MSAISLVKAFTYFFSSDFFYGFEFISCAEATQTRA